MTYDIVRWGFGLFLFVVLFVVLSLVTKKKKGTLAVSSAFAAIIVAAALLLFPVENLFYSFDSVEAAYKYKHHEALVTYGECEVGALCIGQKSDGSFVCYSILKEGDKYKLPTGVDEDIRHRSSKYGYFLMKNFGEKTVILTQVANVEYDGQKFQTLDSGYNYIAVNSPFIETRLSTGGERIQLV